MFRSFLIYLSKSVLAQRVLTGWKLSWRAASRFVAGETIEDAIRVVKQLNEKSIQATLDQLGEHTSFIADADRATNGILTLLDHIQNAKIAANVSLKLTQIGMGMDEGACRRNLSRILERAKAQGNFVRIDMEDSPYTEETIALYLDMLGMGFGPEVVGLVAQSYLYRAEADMRRLLEKGTRFRLVKGAYQEPREVAFPKKVDVDANYDTLTSILLDASLAQESRLSQDGRIPPVAAIATHDEKRIAFARTYAEKIGLPRTGLEFQMLYGIRRDLQETLAQAGYSVRVYVPFGTHWYPYFMRRLAERPANLWFFLSNLFKN